MPITLIENENFVSDDVEVANCLKNFFSNIVKDHEIPKYEVEDDLHLNMSSHPILKAVFKYKNHPSIISIRPFRHQVSNFNFSCIDYRPVRILPIVSKIFEKIMSNQLLAYF